MIPRKLQALRNLCALALLLALSAHAATLLRIQCGGPVAAVWGAR